MFGWQNYGGATRYYSQLLSRLNNDPELRVVFPILFSDNRYIRDCSFAKHWRGAQELRFKGKMRAYRFANEIYDRKKMANTSFDILHPTYYDPYFLDYLKGRPYVVTVLDMIHELFPETLAKGQKRVRRWKEITIPKADVVVAISESTKRDLVKIYGLAPSKIHVIPLATDLSRNSGAGKSSLHLPARYILYVGSRAEGYKNFGALAEAFCHVSEKQRELYLLCVGGGPFSVSENRLFARLGISGKVAQIPANDEELSELYSRACALAYPSRYEGFGIPVLEAFACGCAVAASNSSSLPEVGDDACLYFDAGDTRQIAEKLEALLADENLRNNLVQKGYAQVRKFSWDGMAAKTKETYRTLISRTK
jgi:glycosyltransferase involved in cell wall biosynthesis